MKKYIFSIFQIFLLFFSFSISILFAYDHQYPESWDELQSNDGWVMIKETDRVKIFSKQLDVSPLPASRAEMISNVKMDRLVDAAWLIEKSMEVFPNAYITNTGIYHQRGDTSYTAYQVIDIPFMAPRLYQFNSIRHGNNIHWVKTDTINASYNPDELLLPPVNFGSWEVVRIENQSKITYRLCTDLGGNVPLWIVNQANQYNLPQLLIDLEAYAQKK
tara:strand:+ start:33 stop:686 length:654 start_codon:yes stop_codon:yes gene_type:complete